jgi:hypothetical protein
MKINFVKNIIARFVCWILLLQMINISIDPPDLRPLKNFAISEKEDLSINEIESVYELVSEMVFENNVPETNDDDIDTEPETIDLFCFNVTSATRPVFKINEHFSYYYNNFSFERTAPNSPPPECG